jgi:beta propeller repeat protein
MIVWQVLLKGRYQIMSSDKNSAKTKQITDTAYNNTNPNVHENGAVWQGWVNENWEIFYAADLKEDAPAVMQITSNNTHDMFPQLSGGFITWQSFYSGTWHVFVYDLASGQTTQVTKTADGKYENPRFALLFESRNENGDVETVGYDISSGQEIPISHKGEKQPSHTVPLPQPENDKALPLPAGQSSTSTQQIKDQEGDDGGDDGAV